jgi:alanyl-tRNA synthetase
MKTSDVRTAFLSFFEQRDHRIVPSDSLVPEHDPTLLFTGAGMNQFKDQFLGKNLSFRRAASCQKCFRADDIDEVGRTPCHHSFFEMLGNFSFGDYFKRGAIEYAWEFVTGSLHLDPAKLWVSVYRDDDESYDAWKHTIGLPADRIYRLDEHENFWPADAPTQSPPGMLCGPCTEMFFDMGPQSHCPDPARCDLTCDCKRYVEIWNLVLQQFEKGDAPGELRPLDMKNIDTGMGLERTAAVMQGVRSNFDIDIFRPVCHAAARALGVDYDGSAPSARLVRRIADHTRAVAFLLADGVLPANESRGYVERRLIRRAMRDGLELGAEDPFLYTLVPVVADVMKDAYPELEERRENLARILKAEEERFQTTLANGSRLLAELVADLRTDGRSVLPGEEAFRLYDTYGLPLELTESILEDEGLSIDRAGFDKEMDRQRAQARRASTMTGDVFDTGPLSQVKDFAPPTEFTGYDASACDAVVQAVIVGDDLADSAAAGQEATVVLDRTPFYGEAGGQIGDSGSLTTETGRLDVLDTQRTHGYFLHVGTVADGHIDRGQAARAEVDADRRHAIGRAHTATHLLQNALRTVLGEHVEQAGSLVAPDRLRFDFSHFQAVTPDELDRVEELVNRHVLGAAPVTVADMPLDEAKAAGAMALFGEKYGETVRVVRIGDYSIELCGGTHLHNVAEVGLFRIVSESSIAAGTRRIEAVTGLEAVEHVRRRETALAELARTLGTDESRLADRARSLQDEVRELRAELKKARTRGAGPSADAIVDGASEVDGVPLVVHRADLRMNELRELCDVLKRKLKSGVVVLASAEGGKLSVVVGVTNDRTDRLHAGKMIKDIASVAGGGGGGRPGLAQAGAKNPGKIDELLEAAPDVVAKYLA